MDIEQIRKNAPEGAKFYCISNQNEVIYFKNGIFDWLLYYLDGFWVQANQDVRKHIKPL